jgi:glycosyltransferase involved in cell wall biosynthesis
MRRRHRYDVVHTTGLHLFLFAVLAARPLRRFGVAADWFEVWTPDYWREYLGGVRGRIAIGIQRLGARSRHAAFCFADLHARRLREEGYRGTPTVLGGAYEGALGRPTPRPADTTIVYAGRHIPEKQVPALVAALPSARAQIPGLAAKIFGDGPDRGRVLQLIDQLGLNGAVHAPGFVDQEEVEHALERALCLVLPSRREGYGLIVVESCALGTPAVVVEAPDNAATELVDDGLNGVIAKSSTPEDLTAAIVRVFEAGDDLRRSTADWFAQNGQRLSIESSLQRVVAVYEHI